MKQKKIFDPDKLLEILFVLTLLFASGIVFTLGILGKTLLVPSLTVEFWICVTEVFSIILIVSGSVTTLFELLLLIFCIIDKPVSITKENHEDTTY